MEVINHLAVKWPFVLSLYHTSFMLQQIYMCNKFVYFFTAVSFGSLAGFGWCGHTCCHDNSRDAHATWSGPHLHTHSHLCH